MNPFGVFNRRFRGFRVTEIVGLGLVLVLAMVVYMAKTHAGGEREDIDHIQQQIDEEHGRITLLRAEVAELERPARLSALAHYLNLQPVAANHEIDPNALATVAHAAPPPPAPKTDPAAPDADAPPPPPPAAVVAAAPATPVAAPKASPTSKVAKVAKTTKTQHANADAGDTLAELAAETGSPQPSGKSGR